MGYLLRDVFRLLRREEGQTLTEYAILLVVLVTVALVSVLLAYGSSVGKLCEPISGVLG